MSTAMKLSAFALSLAATFGLAVGVGAAVGPVGGTSAETQRDLPVDHSAMPGEGTSTTRPEEDR